MSKRDESPEAVARRLCESLSMACEVNTDLPLCDACAKRAKLIRAERRRAVREIQRAYDAPWFDFDRGGATELCKTILGTQKWRTR